MKENGTDQKLSAAISIYGVKQMDGTPFKFTLSEKDTKALMKMLEIEFWTDENGNDHYSISRSV